MADLSGKAALVTGASRGLGEGVARALAEAGVAVMLAARDGAAVEAVARDIAAMGGSAYAMAADVSDYAATEALVAATRARCGGLDILVNNAGVIEPIAEIGASDPAAWARNIAINLVGPYNAVRAALPGMIAGGGGTIVNVSSGAAYRPLEGWSAYCSGKAGLAMFTRAIALEAGARGIRAFGFSPGTIDTEMQVKIRASGLNVISQIPREQLSPVADAVRGLVHLCTAGADDLVGQDASMRDEAFRKRLGL
ncbi:SDR family NAD(P)-dependent oxidoreductase [Paracraurococcus lichenis]|uniref:SDR family oxidoreductase n=1 Tax=Paracraurococcus lichenis TaxID=3064888 RepID=A0ABT9E4W1_9PROT|nr:SDR family oxidoreductase [Paracraurococcus sp. LOR1-02]MDO9711204.1 SDR family oxidoreductase [Paracraurococcus sp. LOR1-02]